MTEQEIKLLPGISVKKTVLHNNGHLQDIFEINVQGKTLKEAYDTVLKAKRDFKI